MLALFAVHRLVADLDHFCLNNLDHFLLLMDRSASLVRGVHLGVHLLTLPEALLIKSLP